MTLEQLVEKYRDTEHHFTVAFMAHCRGRRDLAAEMDMDFSYLSLNGYISLGNDPMLPILGKELNETEQASN